MIRKDVCGVPGFRPARTTHRLGAVPSAYPRQDGGGAAQMAQMARVGFRTVESCPGHQVTAAQLAVPPGRLRELRGVNFFWGGAVRCRRLKSCSCCLECPLS